MREGTQTVSMATTTDVNNDPEIPSIPPGARLRERHLEVAQTVAVPFWSINQGNSQLLILLRRTEGRSKF